METETRDSVTGELVLGSSFQLHSFELDVTRGGITKFTLQANQVGRLTMNTCKMAWDGTLKIKERLFLRGDMLPWLSDGTFCVLEVCTDADWI